MKKRKKEKIYIKRERKRKNEMKSLEKLESKSVQ